MPYDVSASGGHDHYAEDIAMRLKIAIGVLAAALALAGGAVYAERAAAAGATPAASAPAAGQDKGARGWRGAGVASLLIKATADVTGMQPSDVLAELRTGKSLAQIAQEKGKTAAEVTSAARTALQQRLDAAVKSGRLTQARADALLQRFDQDAPPVVADTTLGARLGGRAAGRARLLGRAALVQATATVTGLTPEQVRQELRAGKSLAQIAQDKGKTADDIIAELRKQGEARLARWLERAREQLNRPGLTVKPDQPAPTPTASL